MVLTTHWNQNSPAVFVKDVFPKVVSGSYNRTDGHRNNMEFEQYGGYAKLGYEMTGN